jgi:hypothetical protein
MLSAPPVVRKKRVVCETCGCDFSQQSNLKRHIETKHTDQTTPDAVASRLKLKESRNTGRRERRVADPVFRENERQQSQTNRMNKKNKNAHIAGEDVATSLATESKKRSREESESDESESSEEQEDTPKKISGAYPGQWGGGPRDIRIRQLNARH